MTSADTTIQQFRDTALSLFQIGVDAANPQTGLEKAFSDQPLPALQRGRYLVIALGKAANAMATTCLHALPEETPFEALVVTNYENATDIPGATTFAAGHPTPDEQGLAAGKAIMDLLATTTPDDRVIVLISGGGSALVPAPLDGLTLGDKIAVNDLLLANGYAIQEINLVRQTLSKLKGGGLSRLALPATVQSYILSDVVGDDLSVIASGPTNPPLGTAGDALDLFSAKGLTDKLPQTVIKALEAQMAKNQVTKDQDTKQPATRQDGDLSNTTNLLIGSNRISLDAILDAVPLGWRGLIMDDLLEGDVEDVAPRLYDEINAAPEHEKTVYIWGGETTVTLKGTGRGGRNQELALRLAALADKAPIAGHWVFLSGGTDGRDGPTDSAGGLVDAGTLDRIRQTGSDPQALLANNDSYKALEAAQDHIKIKATGTNVADIQICLIDRSSS